jgi:hypothetical protein
MRYAEIVLLILMLSLVILPLVVGPIACGQTLSYVEGFSHAVLDEDFLLTGCSECQLDESSHLGEYNAYTTYEPNAVHSLHIVSFHGDGPFANIDALNAAEYYDISAHPRNVYDGGYLESGYIDEGDINASGTRQVPELEMHIFESTDNSTLSFEGDVTNLGSESFNGFVLVFIIENGLVDPEYPAITWNFVFQAYGLNETLSLGGFSTSTFSGTWSIPTESNATNIHVVAAAFDTDTENSTYGWPYAVQSVCDTDDQVAHDVGITSISAAKTVVGQGFGVDLTAQVANYGTSTEAFSVVAYANSIIVDTQNVTLASGVSDAVTLTWDTGGFPMGNYTLSAFAELAPGETNTSNSTLTGGTVYVGIPGDVDGTGRVDMGDVVSILKAFGSTVGQPNYNPNCDIENTGKVDMSDVVIALRNFGQHYP